MSEVLRLAVGATPTSSVTRINFEVPAGLYQRGRHLRAVLFASYEDHVNSTWQVNVDIRAKVDQHNGNANYPVLLPADQAHGTIVLSKTIGGEQNALVAEICALYPKFQLRHQWMSPGTPQPGLELHLMVFGYHP